MKNDCFWTYDCCVLSRSGGSFRLQADEARSLPASGWVGVMRYSAADKAEAAARLREWFPKGSTVYTVIRNVARSGMSREIGVLAFIPKKDGDGVHVFHPNYAIAALLDLPLNKHGDGVKVRGCGMDMGFWLTSYLSRVLYDDDYALKNQWI